MSIPNWDNTFLSSLWVYRKLRGGCWYLREYRTLQELGKATKQVNGEVRVVTPAVYKSIGSSWTRSGKPSPLSKVMRMENHGPYPPFIAGLGGTLIDGKW